jgi:predicted RNA-binding protein with PIN domain
MQETVIVDGYNLLARLPRPLQSPKSARAYLLKLLVNYSKAKGCRLVVVFGSKQGLSRLPKREGMRVIFTKKNEKVNSLILDLVRRSVDIKKVSVASWDEGLLAEARRLGAKGLKGLSLIKGEKEKRGVQRGSGNTLREVLDEKSLRALKRVARSFKR